MWRRGLVVEGETEVKREIKNKKIGTPYGDEQIDDDIGGGRRCVLVVDESRLRSSRGVQQMGPKKEIRICRLPLSGENWIV